MIQKRIYPQAAVVFLFASLITACAAGLPAATATPVATNTPEATHTPLPTATATTKPTSTPRPTVTPIPPTPTPAPIGVPVTYNSLEITLLDVVTHGHIVPGGTYYYYSKPGETFIDLAVRVRNLEPGRAVQIAWSYIYVIEPKGTWYPLYGETRRVESGMEFDPFNLPIQLEVNGDNIVEFDDDTYMRLIYYVADDPEKTILFGIEDSPLIQFQVKK
jgi:hypothetical protein